MSLNRWKNIITVPYLEIRPFSPSDNRMLSRMAVLNGPPKLCTQISFEEIMEKNSSNTKNSTRINTLIRRFIQKSIGMHGLLCFILLFPVYWHQTVCTLLETVWSQVSSSVILDFEVCISSFFPELPCPFNDRWGKQCKCVGIRKQNTLWD